MYCQNKIVYTVQAGDSLYKLSRQYRTTVTELILGNPGVNPYNLQVGMKLSICPGEGFEMPDGTDGMGGNQPGGGTGNRPGSGTGGNMSGGNMGSGTGGSMSGGTGNRPGSGTGGNMGSGTGNRPGSGTGGNMSGGTGGNMSGGTGNRPGSGTGGSMGNQTQPEQPMMQCNEEMRMAWLNHVFWTRMYLMSAVSDAPDRQATEERLLETADEIADTFAAQFSPSAVRQLRSLLREHIEIGGQMIEALKAGEQADYNALSQRWTANANQIAAFLASQNPFFGGRETVNMLQNHLELTRNEIEQQVKGEYTESIDTFREIVKQAVEMADYFARGMRAR